MTDTTDRIRIRTLRLPDACYETRTTAGGGQVADVMPYDRATDYVTDGVRYGVRYDDGAIDWLGTDPVRAFGDDAAGIEATP